MPEPHNANQTQSDVAVLEFCSLIACFVFHKYADIVLLKNWMHAKHTLLYQSNLTAMPGLPRAREPNSTLICATDTGQVQPFRSRFMPAWL